MCFESASGSEYWLIVAQRIFPLATIEFQTYLFELIYIIEKLNGLDNVSPITGSSIRHVSVPVNGTTKFS